MSISVLPSASITESPSPIVEQPHDRVVIPVRLNPREHGAYAILGVPLATALFIVGLTPATVAVSLAAVISFLAHEPLLIVTGARGNRVKRSATVAARALWIRLSLVAVCGGIAFWLSDDTTRLGLIACLLIAVIECSLSARGRNRTLAAQSLGIAGMTLPCAVVLLAGGVNAVPAVQFFLIWYFGRLLTTVAVRTTIRRHKASATIQSMRSHDAVSIVALVVCSFGVLFGSSLWLVTVPMVASGALLRLTMPRPRRLKTIGWCLLAINIACGLAAIAIW